MSGAGAEPCAAAEQWWPVQWGVPSEDPQRGCPGQEPGLGRLDRSATATAGLSRGPGVPAGSVRGLGGCVIGWSPLAWNNFLSAAGDLSLWRRRRTPGDPWVTRGPVRLPLAGPLPGAPRGQETRFSPPAVYCHRYGDDPAGSRSPGPGGPPVGGGCLPPSGSPSSSLPHTDAPPGVAGRGRPPTKAAQVCAVVVTDVTLLSPVSHNLCPTAAPDMAPCDPACPNPLIPAVTSNKLSPGWDDTLHREAHSEPCL